MGFFIKPTFEKRIKVKNAPVELSEVYVRIEASFPPGGDIVSVEPVMYASKEYYQAGERGVKTDIPVSNSMHGIVLPLTEHCVQSVDCALEMCVNYYQELGYDAMLEE